MKLAILAIAIAAPFADAQVYDFTVNPIPSGLSGTASVEVQTSGTLIGDYDAGTNPNGTRTKPGVFGTFGASENLPVNISLGISNEGPVNSRATGGFRLALDGGLFTMTGYAANLLSSGPVALPTTLSLQYESFRTRNPTSTFIGGIPLSIPLGEASLSRLDAQQLGPAVGTLTPTAPGLFDFSITTLVTISGEVSLLGTPIQIPALPLPLTLAGQLSLSGTSAHLLSVQPFALSNSVEPGIALPQLPFELPTILPPGLTASLLFDLTLESIATSLESTLTTDATGTLVPAPATLMCVPLAALALLRRRRA